MVWQALANECVQTSAAGQVVLKPKTPTKLHALVVPQEPEPAGC